MTLDAAMRWISVAEVMSDQQRLDAAERAQRVDADDRNAVLVRDTDARDDREPQTPSTASRMVRLVLLRVLVTACYQRSNRLTGVLVPNSLTRCCLLSCDFPVPPQVYGCRVNTA